MSKQGKAAAASIYEVLASATRELLETCTADGEAKPTEESLRELFDAMRAASPDECAAIAEWFDKRLAHSSVDVKVKAILLMNDVARLGHEQLHTALQRTCVKTLEQLKSFKGKPHPIHGELPNTMVRNRSAKLAATLQVCASALLCLCV